MVSITVHGSHEIPVLGPDDILGPFGRPDTPRMGPTNEASAMESSFGPDSSTVHPGRRQRVQGHAEDTD